MAYFLHEKAGLVIHCLVKNELNLEVDIDLSKIRQNIKTAKDSLQKISGNEIDFCLMLKADAYGHGLEKVAEATLDIVDSYGVVTLKEGLKTRKIAPKTPILVTMPLPSEIETAIRSRLALGISNDHQLKTLFKCVEKFKRLNAAKGETSSPSINLAVDSGMHRLGFQVNELEKIVGEFKGRGIEIDGVYSHFGDHAEKQADRFERACQIVREEYTGVKRHIASSHTFENPKYVYDGVRIGLSAYLGAMSVKSRVIAVRQVDKGEYIGYGDFLAKEDMQVATVFGGYADGIDRTFKYFTHSGEKLPIISTCMDMTIVDTNGQNLQVGDVVEIVNGDKILETADDFCTIPYTLTTAWKGRINRKYTFR